jgi:nitroreductase
MDLHEVLAARASIRAFDPRPLAPAILDRVLAAALASPSWANTQPYRLALATGDACERLRRELVTACETEVPNGDHLLLFDYPPELQARRRATGFGLYAALGIGREDRDRREAQYRRNFSFFDAPAVAFLFAHEALGSYSVLDAGVFLQTFLLAAAAEGLGTCAQASLASYPQVVRRHFEVPEGYRLLCGVSIGWPAADAPENRYRPGRMAVSELLLTARTSATDCRSPRPPDATGSCLP